MIRVSIFSKSRLLREGITRLLEDDPEIEVLGGETEGKSIEDVSWRETDVILVDRHMLSRVPLPEQPAREGGPRVILLESGAGQPRIDEEVVELISRGILGGIASAETGSELIKKAIRVVASGELWLGHLTIKNILGQAASARRSVTRQESEIATLILRGFCNKEIAKELGISEATVKSHCNRLFKKFNVTGRLQLGLKLKGAHAEGEISPPLVSAKHVSRMKSRAAV